jgi:hypothetical protein
VCIPHHITNGDQIKDDELAGAYGTFGSEEKFTGVLGVEI